MCEKDGELWLATDGGEVSIYNYKNKTVRAIMHLPGDRHSLPVKFLSSVCISMMRIMFGRAVSGED